MLAYNTEDLSNLALQSSAAQALKANLVNIEEQRAINSAFRANFYSPNIFMRIGLGLLTLLVVSSITGIFLLLGKSGKIEPILIFMGLACIGALEFFIKRWKHYRSGVDDILLHSGIMFILVWISLTVQMGQQQQAVFISAVALLLYLAGFIRYLDRLCGLLALVALIIFEANLVKMLSSQPGTLLFFLLAITMGIAFLVFGKIRRSKKFPFHQSGLMLMEYGSAIAGYGALHYYVIRELLSTFWPGTTLDTFPITGWFSWFWTIILPPLCLALGIRRKSLPWIRIGLLCIIILIWFLQHHLHLIDPELAALIFGAMLMGISYAIIKHLKTNDTEFTDDPDAGQPDWPIAEVLAVTAGFSNQAANQPATHSGNTRFNGGDFGGGGAGGQY